MFFFIFSELSYLNEKSVEISPSNGYRKVRFQDPLMTDDPIVSKIALKVVILLYQSSMERRYVVKLKETIVLRGYRTNEAIGFTKGLYEMKKLRGIGITFFSS